MIARWIPAASPTAAAMAQMRAYEADAIVDETSLPTEPRPLAGALKQVSARLVAAGASLELETRRQWLRRYRIDCIPISTGEPFADTLRAFFRRRRLVTDW